MGIALAKHLKIALIVLAPITSRTAEGVAFETYGLTRISIVEETLTRLFLKILLPRKLSMIRY